MPMLLAVIGTFLTAITLPLILELFAVTLLFLCGPKRRSRAVGPVPRLTVVVPAHNEEGFIQNCVESLLRSAQGAARVLVIAQNLQRRNRRARCTVRGRVADLQRYRR